MYLLGLDGGDTKTEIMLCTESGRIIGRAHGSPSVLTGKNVAAALSNIESALDEATFCIGGRKNFEGVAYAGFSGASNSENRGVFSQTLPELLPGASICRCGSAALAALSAALGTGDGIVAIADTSSAVFARHNGKMVQVGGWGFLLGDDCSAYDMGRRALVATLMMQDGRGEETEIASEVSAIHGGPLGELIATIYASDSKRMISNFAPALLNAAANGDPVAMRELYAATDRYALSIRTAGRECACDTVVMSGNMWKNAVFTSLMQKKLRGMTFVRPELPPVYGSVVEAAALAGIDADESFRSAFSAGIK